MNLEDVKNLKEKIRNNTGLVISRVPENTRKEFIEFANGEFAGDYGLLLRELWETYKQYHQIVKTQDIKLDYIITMVKNKNNNQSNIEEKKIKMLGRINQKEEQNNEQIN